MRGWSVLSIAIAGILLTWLCLLPWLGKQKAVQARIQFLESQQIDPAAMFYTDLEVMDKVHARISTMQEQDLDVFWNPQ